jgi:hypothetical protein
MCHSVSDSPFPHLPSCLPTTRPGAHPHSAAAQPTAACAHGRRYNQAWVNQVLLYACLADPDRHGAATQLAVADVASGVLWSFDAPVLTPQERCGLHIAAGCRRTAVPMARQRVSHCRSAIPACWQQP